MEESSLTDKGYPMSNSAIAGHSASALHAQASLVGNSFLRALRVLRGSINIEMHSARRSGAFSLLELLVVIAILGLMAGLLVPAVGSLMTSSQLTEGTDFVAGQLKYARQLASSENKVVEVRFYKYSDPAIPGSGVNLRAIQLWRNNPDGTRSPVERPHRFPGRVVASSDPTLTTLGADLSLPTSSPEIVTSLPAYTFKAFQFRPDGSTSLTNGSNFLTLINENDPVKTAGIPANFSAIQLEVLTGAVKVFRP